MSVKSSDVIRVGSRKSELALIQTKHVISRLQKLHPEEKFEIHTMSTIGDRVLNVSLPKIGEKSLFTRDLEDALLKGGVDFVVHSLKDLPTALPPGMTIGAVLEREDSRDALVLNEKYKGMTIEKLPAGCIIGTSSLRRTAQLRRKYPHLEVCDIRGNLNTRLAKLDAPNSKFAGIILAQAGLLRMGWNNRISQILEPAELLYAVGQGALAVECRANDNKTLNMLRQLMCLQTMCRILAERSFLKTLGGGCSAPVAVCTNLLKTGNNKKNEIQLEITGAVWSLDGTTQIQDKIDCFLNLHSQEVSETGEDEDVSPRKRVKPNEDSENDENLNKKQGSPKVINDDLDVNRAGGDGEQVADLNHLIELHGELFKRCPFYSLHQRDKDNGNAPSAHECPLKIPVGQDFMGKCPYVGTQEKVDLCHAEGVCPVTGNVSKNVSASKKPPKAEQSKTDGASTSKCPFTSKIADFMPKTADKLQNQDITPKDCPFLQKNIKLVDYEAIKPNISEVIYSLPDVSDELFCGLFRHECYSQNIYTKCESLGQKLADNLIRNGALDVMKCAQDEIREKM